MNDSKKEDFSEKKIVSPNKVAHCIPPPPEEKSHGELFNKELCLPGFHPMLPQ